MRNRRVAYIFFWILSLFVCYGLLSSQTSVATAIEPLASITFAEGSSFSIVRAGKTIAKKVSDSDTFGFSLLKGDIVQTAQGTFLELYSKSTETTLQIAENTTFKCDLDASGNNSTGELYYGRIRAKVAKLAGSRSYTISTPTLVAGVRGTDFGCDVISNPGSRVLHRVFCFEGSVAVSLSPAITNAVPAVPAVLVSGGQMVEKLEGTGVTATLPVSSVSAEVQHFWDLRPIHTPNLVTVAVVVPVVDSPPAEVVREPAVWKEGPFTVTEIILPEGSAELSKNRNVQIPGIAVSMLVGFGTIACGSVAYISSSGDTDNPFIQSGHSGGMVMISSGLVLAIISALFP